jgi:hypothetical protein
LLTAHADLSPDRKRIEVRFPYSKDGLEAIHYANGSWSPAKRAWYVNLDLTSAERLREAFGAGLSIGRRLRVWGRAERRRLAHLRELARASDADLELVPKVMPTLASLLDNRPYQRADIARMSERYALNANEPGTGKTIEVIGAVAEAGLLDRPVLTLAPVRAIENTWGAELARVEYPHETYAYEDTSQRKGAINWCWTIRDERPFWLVSNPDLLRVKPAKDGQRVVVKDPLSGNPYAANQWTENLLEIEWGAVIIDEFQKFGLTNPRSQFGLAARLLKADLFILVSGTPMGGKFKRLWAALNWLDPETYGSWWRWASQWLIIKDNGFGKVVLDDIQPGRERDFQAAHAHHFLRRTKLADLPGCPPKVFKTIYTPMTKQQERQYRKFEREAEIRISQRRVTGHGILAEWQRLKQFANATCRTVVAGKRVKLLATPDSGKLPYLLDALDEIGVRKSAPEPGARAIVGSMDKSFAKITAAFLQAKGIDADTLTGDTKHSRPLIERFNGSDRKPYVIVMTIQTGGVSLNLEASRGMYALDESWDPDDMEQFFERGDRGTRTTPLVCVTFRTEATIQEYIADVAGGKAINNENAYKFVDALRERAGDPRGH